MAIVQISRITHRKGLAENLPQLAGAEFGWVIDERKLYIGNGTLEDGAPAIGNTEILTEYSDILNLAESYTYEGEAGGYIVQTGPTSANPVTRTLQAKFDDFASVKDFGATGDGVTDDTAAINRALFQLFCRETNTQVRRSLFFPAGTYKTTDTIKIPPFAKLYGEGNQSSIIQLVDETPDYVARTADSDQQTGANIGNNSAITPTGIEIRDMGFTTTKQVDIFFVEDTTQINFFGVEFKGALTSSNVNTIVPLSCIHMDSTTAITTGDVTFEHCTFTGSNYGIYTNNTVEGVSVENCKFHTLYNGVNLGTDVPPSPPVGGPSGFRIVQNIFDAIYDSGIIFGEVNLNVSGYNIFLDVGNELQGLSNPTSANIDIQYDNNVSIGDMFERDDARDAIVSRIDINSKKVFAIDNGQTIKFGTYNRDAGNSTSLTVGSGTIFSVDVDDGIYGFKVDYRWRTDATGGVRFGTLMVAPHPGGAGDSTQELAFMDDFTQNENDPGLTIGVSQASEVSTVNITYTATVSGVFQYSISYLG